MRKNRFRRGKGTIVLTNHFCVKWRDRYGFDPLVREVENILFNAALAQRSRRLDLADGAVSHEPGVYVDFDRRVCLLVDEAPTGNARVITFLDESDMRENGNGQRPAAVGTMEECARFTA